MLLLFSVEQSVHLGFSEFLKRFRLTKWEDVTNSQTVYILDCENLTCS